MSNELFKPPGYSSGGIQLNKLRSTASPFQQRVNQAQAQQIDAASLPHRICLMLDQSSSMASQADYDKPQTKSKIELLKEAVQNFIQRCDFRDTAIAIETFPPSLQISLSANSVMLGGALFALNASGSTPMQACVQRVLTQIPLTRGVLVSDGEATDWRGSRYDDDEETQAPREDKLLATYKEQGIPIDCVHIGSSSSGEELLRRIAKETGGLYLKFTDVSAFSTAFGFLTPSYRAQLTDGSIDAKTLGAKELKR